MNKELWENESTEVDENPYELDYLKEQEIEDGYYEDTIDESVADKSVFTDNSTFSFSSDDIDTSLFNHEPEETPEKSISKTEILDEIPDITSVTNLSFDPILFGNGEFLRDTIIEALRVKSVKDAWEGVHSSNSQIDSMSGQQLWNFIQNFEFKTEGPFNNINEEEYLHLRNIAINVFKHRISILYDKLEGVTLSEEDNKALSVANKTLQNSKSSLGSKLFSGIWSLVKLPLLPITFPMKLITRSIQFGYGVIEASYKKLTSFFNSDSSGYKTGSKHLTLANALSLALVGGLSYYAYDNNMHTESQNYIHAIYSEEVGEISNINIDTAKKISLRVYEDALDVGSNVISMIPEELYLENEKLANSWDNIPHLPSKDFGTQSILLIAQNNNISNEKAYDIYQTYFQRFQKQYRDCVEVGRKCSLSLSVGRNTIVSNNIDRTSSIVFNGVEDKFTIYNSNGSILIEEDLKTDAILDNNAGNSFVRLFN